MNTIILGGGKGCRSLLDLTRGSFLKELSLQVVAVIDKRSDAPGVCYAKEIGIPVFFDINEALENYSIDIIIELTGNDNVLQELFKIINPKIKVIDHTIARIFWDLVNAKEIQENQLKELNKLEINIEKERYFLQSIFDSLTDLAVVLDRNQNIIRVNANLADFLGIEASSVIGKKYLDIIDKTVSDEDIDEAGKGIEDVFKTGEASSYRRITRTPDNRQWEILRSPIKNDSGEVIAVLGTWHQITEKLKLLREKEIAEKRLKAFIDSAQDWISIKDMEGRYVLVNPVTARAFNLPAESFIGKKPDEILPLKLAETINRHDREVISIKHHRVFDEIIPVNGEDHHFDTIRFPLMDNEGQTIGVCTIARDNTKEIKLQEQLVQSEKMAALGKLAAGVAHEINNPLTGILAYAEDIMEEYHYIPLLQEDMKVIIKETLRCRDIVKNLLDFAKLDKPKFEAVEINEIISDSLRILEKLPQFKDINIEKYLGKNLPFIQGDPQQLQQVILNLILNAVDALKNKGTIKITSDYHRNTANCMISIEDSGSGIPENLIDKIFEPFFSTKGTSGLGLAVSWGIIERHKGNIEVDMAESGGAIFRILLPAKYI